MPKVVAPDKNPMSWQHLKIGGVRLPGIIQKAKVFGQLDVITVGVAGEDGTIKADPKVGDDEAYFELLIVDDPASGLDHFTDFANLRRVYKPLDGKAKPATVTHPLFTLWGVTAMFVQELSIEYDRTKKNTLMATVRLVNNAPTKVVKKKESSKGGKKAELTTQQKTQQGEALDTNDQFTGSSDPNPTPSTNPPGPTIGTQR